MLKDKGIDVAAGDEDAAGKTEHTTHTSDAGASQPGKGSVICGRVRRR